MEVSKRISAIAPSGSIAIAAKIAKLRKNGEHIIGLNVGEPDFQAPDKVIQATVKALKEGKTRYSLVRGEDSLREEIARYYNRKFSRKISEENILVGNGSKQVLYNAFQAILDEGDEVIIPIPYWVTIPESVKLAGGVNVFVDSKENFHLDLEKIEAAITEKTKVIYINTPNNPTGVVYTRDELTALGELAKKHDLFIISDEAYEALVYDGEFVTPSTLSQDLFERTICVQSFSKTFCMTGFRIGYMIANEELISHIDRFQGHLCGNIAPFSQYGAAQALKSEDEIVTPLLKEMRERRDLSYELFSKLFPCHRPEGAFYLFLDINPYIQSGLVKDSAHMVEFLIEKAKVALVPGISFGQEGYIRLAYTATKSEIEEAFNRMSEVLKA
ncbi:pyridoxal phosphate-dependent aminotransferase [Bacteriovorax sp. DB6_IX]|uniref:pyridoxal phosphate-dependent aminotransferase n=1 Tax=Bacteriovorax sp. DB6_IX TaxID=1353530 RepID=UPI00038A0AFD|nr:pyridoxal phosphate-dependent aminotransferase [Bacteriovorax sp. DB6_IX]EQC52115.1 putative aspartate transaminase [Bacteriovorax sp. DB6_IX]